MKLGVHLDRAVLSPVRPLVVPVRPGVGESLPGLVARSTRLNVLRHPRIILSEIGIESMGAGTIGIDIAGLEHRLAAKIGCSVEDVLSRATPFVPGSANREILYGQAAMSRNDLDLDARRISPTSLKRTKVHLAAWTCRLLPFCPESLERLISVCPNCGVRLGWVAAWGVDTCEHCRERVVHPDGEMLEPHLVEGYRTFAKLISPDPVERADAMAGLPSQLQECAPPDLVRVIVGIGRKCRVEPLPRYRPGVPAGTIADIVSLGTELLHDFPKRIRARIVAEIATIGWDREAPLRPMLQGLRALGRQNVGRPEQVKLIRDAIPEVFEPKPRALGGMRASVMLLKDIREHHCLSTQQMRSIIEARVLKFSMNSDSRRSKVQYDRDSTMDFIHRLKASEQASALEGAMGIPRYAVEQLVCLNEVSREDHPAIELIHPGLRLVLPSTYMADISAAKRSGIVPWDAIPLKRAIRCIGGRSKPWGTILKAMRAGDLPFWLSDKERRGDDRPETFVTRALVRPSKISAFAQQVFKEGEHPGFPHFAANVSQLDSCDLLNIDFLQMKRLIAAGGLDFAAQGKATRAPKDTVLELARDMISPTEICVRWEVHPSSVNKLMTLNPSIARVYVGWSRTDVEREMAGRADAARAPRRGRTAGSVRNKALPATKIEFNNPPPRASDRATA